MNKNMNVLMVSIDKIKRDLNQPRKEWNDEELKAHGHSFEVHGVINPIEVDEDYVIITGESRWRSAKLVGIKEIPVIVVKGLDVRQRYYRQAAENLARTPLSPLEQLDAVKKVWSDVAEEVRTGTHLKAGGEQPTDLMYREVSRRLGISESWVRNLVDKIGTAHPEIQQMFREGKIQVTAIREIRKIKKPEVELRLAKKASKENFTRDDVDSVVKAIVKHPEKTEELLGESYPKKHDELVVIVDSIVNKSVMRKSTGKEIEREKAKELSSIGTRMLEIMGNIKLEELEPITLAMLYNATATLPKFMWAFNQKIKAMIPKELAEEKKPNIKELQAIVDATREEIK